MEGFILVYRRLQRNFVFEQPYFLKLWLFCLMRAAYQETEALVGAAHVHLARGQFIWGRNEAAYELNRGLKKSERKSATTWENMLKRLEQEGMVQRSPTARYTVVSVLNYDGYQTRAGRSLTDPSREKSAAPVNCSTNSSVGESIDMKGLESFPPMDVGDFSDTSLTEKRIFDEQVADTNNNPKNRKQVMQVREEDVDIPENDNPVRVMYDPYQAFSKAYTYPLTAVVRQSIATWIERFDGQGELVAFAILQAGRNGANSPKYFERILSTWERQGIRTLIAAKEQQRQYDEAQSQREEERFEKQRFRLENRLLPREQLPEVSLHNWLE